MQMNFDFTTEFATSYFCDIFVWLPSLGSSEFSCSSFLHGSSSRSLVGSFSSYTLCFCLVSRLICMFPLDLAYWLTRLRICTSILKTDNYLQVTVAMQTSSVKDASRRGHQWKILTHVVVVCEYRDEEHGKNFMNWISSSSTAEVLCFTHIFILGIQSIHLLLLVLGTDLVKFNNYIFPGKCQMWKIIYGFPMEILIVANDLWILCQAHYGSVL
jgi:hypothetical protein